MINLRHLKKGNIFGNLNDFKPKNDTFDYFYKKIGQKFTKLGVLVAKNHQNLKKIQRSIFIP